jgi:hypothetical protein
MVRRPVLALVFAVGFAVAGSNLALAAGTLMGETFAWTGSATSVTGSISCNSTHIHYSVRRGVAAGPVAGRFDESGDIAVTNGVVTGWTATFKIYPLASTQPTLANGTKSLAVGGAATCNGVAGLDSATAMAVLNYSVTFTAAGGGGSETGVSVANLNMTLGFSDITTGTFTETFGQQPGCDSTGNSQGNDDCQQ